MFCPNCGYKNEDFARFCEECGEALEQYWDEEPATQSADAAEAAVDSTGTVGAAPGVNVAQSTAAVHTAEPQPQRMQATPTQPLPASQPKQKGVNPAVIIAAGVAVFVVFVVLAVAVVLIVTKILKSNSNGAVAAGTETAIEETVAETVAGSESTDTVEAAAESESEPVIQNEAAQSETAYPYAGAWNEGNININTIDGVRYSIYINGLAESSEINGGEYVLTGYVRPDTGELICSGKRIDYDVTHSTVVTPVADGEISFYTEGGKTFLRSITDTKTVELSTGAGYTAPKDIYYLPLSVYGETGNSIILTSSELADSLIGGPLTLNKPLSVYESTYLVQQGGYNNTGLMAMDGDTVTSWQIEHDGYGEWIRWAYQGEISADVIKLNVGNWRSAELYQKNDRPSLIKLILYNEKQLKDYTMYIELPDLMTQHTIVLPQGFKATGAELYLLDVYKGSAYDDNCISEIQIMSR